MIKLITDKIIELNNRIEFLESFNNMGGKIWIEQTNGVPRREQIKILNAQVEVLREVIKNKNEDE